MNNYIGLDAHSKTCTFVVLNEQGQETAVQQIRTGESEIIRFIESIKGSKSLVFEEGNLGKWLYTILKDRVDKLVVCDPAFVNRRVGSKDDYPDALHLAQQLRGNFLTPVFHEDSFFSELRSVVSAYLDLVKDTVKAQNRYKALYRSRALNTDGKRIYRDEKRLGEFKKETEVFVAESLYCQSEFLREQKKNFLSRFKKYEKEHKEISALSSIPGIGEIRACVIAAIVCSPQRFPSKFKFWSYCCLVKHDSRSDGVSYGKRNSRGNMILKDVFMGAAKTVLAGDGYFRKYYDKCREDGANHSAAKKNVARKIAAVALATMRKGVRYQENYETKKAKRVIESSLKHSAAEV